VRDDYVSNHRGSTSVEWKKFASRSSNETSFKYSVTLLDNIDVIVVGERAGEAVAAGSVPEAQDHQAAR